MAGSRHPSLHEPGEAGDTVRLRASRCMSCGLLVLPPETLGCRRCGASEYEPLALAGTGVVRVSTVVHNDALGSIPIPYTVARLALDAPGRQRLVTDGLLTGAPVPRGTRVYARLAELSGDRLEVRFARRDET